MKTTVLLADDHTLLREGIKRIIQSDSNYEVIGEASNGIEAFSLIQKRIPDIAVVDINMPEMDGLDLLKQIKAYAPKTKVLVLSMYPEDQYGLRVMKNEADGYLTKESAPEQLMTAINRIKTGRKYISQELAERLVYELQSDFEGEPHERLSDREFQVFLMIASGKSVGDIAKELNLSVKTISTNRSRILEKMNLKNNSELTHYAFHNGLVE